MTAGATTTGLRTVGQTASPGDPRRDGNAAIRRPVAPRARLLAVLTSFVQWNLTHARWRLGNLVDTLRGRGSLDNKALRLRKAIQRMGATGVKVGQQLAMRIDLMPLEFSLALRALDDRQQPMAESDATHRIEKAVGASLGEVFARFDPVPVSSSTAFCVYRAVLHDGQEVVVKVRRGGVRSRLSADIVAVSWILWVLEGLTIWRPAARTTFPMCGAIRLRARVAPTRALTAR